MSGIVCLFVGHKPNKHALWPDKNFIPIRFTFDDAPGMTFFPCRRCNAVMAEFTTEPEVAVTPFGIEIVPE